MNIWEERYQAENFGWDAGTFTPALNEWCELQEGRFSNVAAVGVGTGYDLIPLSSVSQNLVALDIAATAKRRFDEIVKSKLDEEAKTQFLLEDFFEYRPEQPFDLIWDYTFLCAIDPSQREAWAATMGRLIKKGGTLLALIFPVVEKDDGPPFALVPYSVHRLLADNFDVVSCTAPAESHEGRSGKEFLTEYRRK